MINEEILNNWSIINPGVLPPGCGDCFYQSTYDSLLNLISIVKDQQKQEDIEIAKTYYQQGSLGYTVGQQIAQAIFEGGK